MIICHFTVNYIHFLKIRTMGARLSHAIFEEEAPYYAEPLTAIKGQQSSTLYVDERLKLLKVKAKLKKIPKDADDPTQQFSEEREFAWQEKVFGQFEIAAVREDGMANTSSGATSAGFGASAGGGAANFQSGGSSSSSTSYHLYKKQHLSAENLRQIQQLIINGGPAGVAGGGTGNANPNPNAGGFPVPLPPASAVGDVLFSKVSGDEFPNIRTRILEEHKLLDRRFGRRSKSKEGGGQKLPKMGTALGYKQPKSMYIMAALEENEKRYEVELASLSALGEGLGALEIAPMLYESAAASEAKRKKSLIGPELTDSKIIFSLPGGSKYEFTMELAGQRPDADSRKKAIQKIQEIDLKSVALRRNLAGHGFEGFTIEKDEDEVISVFAEILSYEPKKSHPDEDYVIRNVDPDSVPHDIDLWEERCMLKSVQRTGSQSGLLGARAEFYYVMYEFHESNLYKFKYRSEEALDSQHAGKRACTLWSAIGSTETAAIFNHGLECHFGRKKEESENLPLAPVPLRLLLQVYKKDSWDRHIFLGYSYVDIPDRSGEYDISARMWAPSGTVREQLTNYFCGAAATLLSPSYIVNTDNEQNPSNRSFLKTTTVDGNVRILLNVVRQVLPKQSNYAKNRGRSRGGRVVSGRTGGAPQYSSEQLKKRREERASQLRQRNTVNSGGADTGAVDTGRASGTSGGGSEMFFRPSGGG